MSYPDTHVSLSPVSHRGGERAHVFANSAESKSTSSTETVRQSFRYTSNHKAFSLENRLQCLFGPRGLSEYPNLA